MIKISNEVKEILKKVNEESIADKEKLIDDINRSISIIIGPDEAYETLENIINDYINTGKISLEELIPEIDRDARYALTKAYKMSMYSDKRLIEEFCDVHHVDFDMEKYNKIKADLKAQNGPRPYNKKSDVYTHVDAEKDSKIKIK